MIRINKRKIRISARKEGGGRTDGVLEIRKNELVVLLKKIKFVKEIKACVGFHVKNFWYLHGNSVLSANFQLWFSFVGCAVLMLTMKQISSQLSSSLLSK